MIEGKYYRRAVFLKETLKRAKAALEDGKVRHASRLVASAKKSLDRYVREFKADIGPLLEKLYGKNNVMYELNMSITRDVFRSYSVRVIPKMMKMDEVLSQARKLSRTPNKSESSSSSPPKVSTSVGCYVVLRSSYLLVHKRGKSIRSPGLICGPGGSVKKGQNDIETLNKELSEEALNDTEPPKMKWTMFAQVGNNFRNYYADGSKLQIAGPGALHKKEVDMDYAWDDLPVPVHEIPGTGHAWIKVDDILKCPRRMFLRAFFNNVSKLKKVLQD
jgi:hypothetical protein